MATQRTWIWRAEALIVGGVLLLVGQPSWAQAPMAHEQLQPVPESTPTMADIPSDTSMLQGESSFSEEGEYDECFDFCGMPCCSPPGRFWLRADYLMWWTKGTQLPPLVTTSPQGTAEAQAGALAPYGNASVLYGDSTVLNDGRSGVRATMGMWLDDCHKWDLEFDYLTLGGRSVGFNQYSTGGTILARPLYDVEAIHQGRELVSYPGVVEGRVTVGVKDYFQSAGVSLSYNLCCCDSCESCCDPCEDWCGIPRLFCCRTDLILGYRYYNLSDSVEINEDLRITETGPTQNWLFNVSDNFRASNNFHGSEIGLRTRLYRGRWSMEILAKMAVGNNHETVTIDGQTIVTPTSQPTEVRDGGVYAVRSNVGTYTRDTFTVIPQLGLELGYQLNCHWRAHIGYNLLYWGCVSRASDAIDLNIDPRNIPVTQDPALPFPAFQGQASCFWAQGVSLGAELRF